MDVSVGLYHATAFKSSSGTCGSHPQASCYSYEATCENGEAAHLQQEAGVRVELQCPRDLQSPIHSFKPCSDIWSRLVLLHLSCAASLTGLWFGPLMAFVFTIVCGLSLGNSSGMQLQCADSLPLLQHVFGLRRAPEFDFSLLVTIVY